MRMFVHRSSVCTCTMCIPAAVEPYMWGRLLGNTMVVGTMSFRGHSAGPREYLKHDKDLD